MGIIAEFNPDLALRSYKEYESGQRKLQECVPKDLHVGLEYEFLKKGQRLYWLSNCEYYENGQIPLCLTAGDQRLSSPIASVKILYVTHFLAGNEVWTKGVYKIIEIFNDDRIHFNGLRKI